ncbi:hypothetical protein Pmani_032037 [Petrolisthes manimaculis]|uniref:Uncharacterized protein n=1 Tax=Petrolisthes manimaculis TaxID=1843537 RepID=A0AAE1NTF2_9EUCA|nr:hypothetical protein Pmani_032037 [Petrolisthes manimaculis]
MLQEELMFRSEHENVTSSVINVKSPTPLKQSTQSPPSSTPRAPQDPHDSTPAWPPAIPHSSTQASAAHPKSCQPSGLPVVTFPLSNAPWHPHTPPPLPSGHPIIPAHVYHQPANRRD